MILKLLVPNFQVLGSRKSSVSPKRGPSFGSSFQQLRRWKKRKPDRSNGISEFGGSSGSTDVSERRLGTKCLFHKRKKERKSKTYFFVSIAFDAIHLVAAALHRHRGVVVVVAVAEV